MSLTFHAPGSMVKAPLRSTNMAFPAHSTIHPLHAYLPSFFCALVLWHASEVEGLTVTTQRP